MNWYIKVIKQYADFSGRARRTEYWMFQLFNMLAVIGLVFIGFFIGATTESLYGMIPLILYGLFVFVPTLAVIVRRLHDQDKSGWLIFLQFIPYVGGIIIFVFMVMEGTRGPNTYGQDPKNPDFDDIDEIGQSL
jgi:uncharacterized membrane protein YhaH (DUF805 family)